MKCEEVVKVGASRIEHTANEQFLPIDEAVRLKLKAAEQKKPLKKRLFSSQNASFVGIKIVQSNSGSLGHAE